ncbi:hypothetical protein KFL_012850010 [Klebsormidium nitens]|uniref:Uncharacterized protein n=1 Tax=Klebsormidium nitens TaxID=105231 RepID=A0A1Y1IW02_KLENI|nr:hypothetical protein KFL_012850010 [Klebsormidium nitens]|eukprot:GAQ93076.1 hypothetical protein KFL_012850010 [Klebsormidium nitens]
MLNDFFLSLATQNVDIFRLERARGGTAVHKVDISHAVERRVGSLQHRPQQDQNHSKPHVLWKDMNGLLPADWDYGKRWLQQDPSESRRYGESGCALLPLQSRATTTTAAVSVTSARPGGRPHERTLKFDMHNAAKDLIDLQMVEDARALVLTDSTLQPMSCASGSSRWSQTSGCASSEADTSYPGVGPARGAALGAHLAAVRPPVRVPSTRKGRCTSTGQREVGSTERATSTGQRKLGREQNTKVVLIQNASAASG